MLSTDYDEIHSLLLVLSLSIYIWYSIAVYYNSIHIIIPYIFSNFAVFARFAFFMKNAKKEKKRDRNAKRFF